MMKEGAYVMSQSGMEDPESALNAVRDGTIREVEKRKPKHYSEYYRDFDPTLIELLRDTFRWEIELFNYPDNPFTT